LALLRSCVITLHETSQAHILRKLALFPFSIRPKCIIFPSEFERRFATRWVPWISGVSSVIAVPSNIEAAVPHPARTINEIVNFGLIMPKKGLDDVMTLGALIQSSGLPLRLRVIGTTPARHRRYFASLRSKASALPIVWEHDLTEEQVADRLASSSVAYLPYPDGASERRASLKAALINGVAVITTRGAHTPTDLEGSVRFCQTPEEALAAARTLLDSAEERARLVKRAVQYVRQYTWEVIAELHSAVYKDVLSRKCSRGTQNTGVGRSFFSQL